MLKSKEWSIQKILQLAQLHESIISNLHPLYLENLQDIHHIVNDAGGSLLEGFLNTSVEGKPIFHSMHNMGHGKNKVLLTNKDQHDSAIETLGTIHETLFSQIDTKYHSNVFLPPKKVQLVSKQNDTISACNYSHYANDLLSNHQQLTLDHTISTKWPRIVHLTYSSAVSYASASPSVNSRNQTDGFSQHNLILDRQRNGCPIRAYETLHSIGHFNLRNHNRWTRRTNEAIPWWSHFNSGWTKYFYHESIYPAGFHF